MRNVRAQVGRQPVARITCKRLQFKGGQLCLGELIRSRQQHGHLVRSIRHLLRCGHLIRFCNDLLATSRLLLGRLEPLIPERAQAAQIVLRVHIRLGRAPDEARLAFPAGEIRCRATGFEPLALTFQVLGVREGERSCRDVENGRVGRSAMLSFDGVNDCVSTREESTSVARWRESACKQSLGFGARKKAETEPGTHRRSASTLESPALLWEPRPWSRSVASAGASDPKVPGLRERENIRISRFHSRSDAKPSGESERRRDRPRTFALDGAGESGRLEVDFPIIKAEATFMTTTRLEERPEHDVCGG